MLHAAHPSHQMALRALPFDDVRSSRPRDAFTCHRLQRHTSKHSTHAVGGATNTTTSVTITLADVVIGMPVALEWVSHTALGLDQLCSGGQLLACAALTWMEAAGPALEVLLLAGCSSACYAVPSTGSSSRTATASPRHRECGRNASSFRHTSYNFSRAEWLSRPQLPRIHLRCFWGSEVRVSKAGEVTRYRKHKSYIKTAALLQAMLETLPQRRYYIKCDVDTLLRPASITQFLSALTDVLPQSSDRSEGMPRLYFGNDRLTEPCDGNNDRCRSFTFNKVRRNSALRGSSRRAPLTLRPCCSRVCICVSYL